MVVAAPAPRGESSFIDERGNAHSLTGKTDHVSRRSDLNPANVDVLTLEERHPAGEIVSRSEDVPMSNQRRNDEIGDVTDADEAPAYDQVAAWGV